MRLQEIFESLAMGEFSQLSIGGQEQGVVNASNYPNVLNHVNLALTTIFTRFTLLEGRVVLALQDMRENYALTSEFAVNGRSASDGVRYLLDTEDDPFKDDILKVERVLTEKGIELALNDKSNPQSVTTPSALKLRVPHTTKQCFKTDTLTLVYRANHPKIKFREGYFEPARIEVQLPESHLMALLYFVASRVNNPIGMTNEFNAGNNYAVKFEQECQRLESEGLEVDQGSGNDRLERGGWA